MKKVIALTFFLLASVISFGSHIVGGEFEIEYIRKNIYRINLILYFDVKNGNEQARDDFVFTTIFRKLDDLPVRNVSLVKVQESRVEYFQPACSTGEVITDKIVYSATVVLQDEDFNDPEGYYIVWQRCCRNYTITNIYSAEPGNGITAGQTFYLEFPPIVDSEGEEFVNSTPQLFPPLNDYGCPNRPYWVDFAGTDFDGDSLVYELATPLSTQFSGAFPPGNQNLPAPYPTTIWRPGFSLDNIVNGAPDLNISKKGFLTVTPKSQGLFVFAVKVSEYRDSVKIGEVRRDFQLWVVDKCPVADPPRVLGRKSSEAAFTYENYMDVTFSKSLADEERCIQIQVSDADAFKEVDDFEEDVWVKAIPINFEEDVDEILPEITKAKLTNGSTFNLDICFPECPYREEGPFQVGLVAFDDACTLPLSDTLFVTVNIEPPPNASPYFSNGSQITKEVVEQKDGFWSVDLVARDDDMDSISFQAFPQGFVMDDYGMTINTYMNEAGEVRTRFDWNYDCTQISFDDKNAFEILYVIEDYDQCLFNYSDTLKMNLKVILPDNTLPEISMQGAEKDQKYFKINRSIYESLTFQTLSEDPDNDPIIVEGEGSNFSFDDYSVSFPTTNGTGNPGLSVPFSWNLNCQSLKESPIDSFRFYLMVEDFDYCNITSRDTLTVDLIVDKPPNTNPGVTFTPLNEEITVESNTEISMEIDIPVQVEVLVTDPDPNNISLELWGVDGPGETDGFEFSNVSGFQTVNSVLKWVPECGDLNLEDELTMYTFIFRVTDDDCRNPAEEFVEYVINLQDIYNDIEEFSPPNVFTPNSDEYNNFFALEWVDEKGSLITSGLPRDNCRSTFEEVKIVNRWGREVFRSNDRQFKWFGGDQPAGVYYYYVKYSNREFKGNVTILY